MHILFTTGIDTKYGVSHSLFQMLSALLQLDSTIKLSVVLPYKSTYSDEIAALGCDVYRVRYLPFLRSAGSVKSHRMLLKSFLGYWYGRLFGVLQLRRCMDVSSVDIVHSNSSRNDFGAILVRKYKKPMIWHIREFGDLDFQCISFRRNYIQLMNRTANRCIAVSDAVREHWIKKGLRREKLIRIYNGVESEVRVKENYGTAGGGQLVRFLVMGSISETKGQMQLVEAVGLLPESYRNRICVDIVGGVGEAYSKVLVDRIDTLGLGTVICMKGYQKDYFRDIAEYDCGVICSRSEGFGRVTAEYMMAGLPVIASNAGANPELVSDRGTGLLYELNDMKDLARKIMMIVDRPELRERLGRNAMRRARDCFSIQKHAEEIYKVYREVLEEASQGR